MNRRSTVNFIKSRILTGLYVLLPLMLLWLGLREIGGLLADMADPIADMFPSEYFDDLSWPGIVAGLLIVGASFVVGLAALLSVVERLSHKFEQAVLYRIPMYKMLKIISSSLVRAETSDVKPAILKSGDGGGDPCYVMEEHGTGLATVLLPWSPASFAGSIKVVPTSQLQYLQCSIDEFSRSISFMGIGVADCLAQSTEKADQGQE
jgi:uncharacterized membrane protein